MNKLLIATNNKGKLIEFKELLTGIDVQFVIPAQIQLDLDVLEDGRTYAENAAKKAVAFANASGLISLADDSGLEVDALNGEPGLYSARYGSVDGVKLSDAERRNILLGELQGHPRPWTARFKATIAVAAPGNIALTKAKSLHLTEGICEGEIIPEERGTGGFGYDPIFLLSGLEKTMAELSMEEKNRLSHRARAVIQAQDYLRTLFSEK
jgi:XTP/dITP diphosphohydrolase